MHPRCRETDKVCEDGEVLTHSGRSIMFYHGSGKLEA